MHSASSNAAYDNLAQSVIATLPDSITRREERLRDLLAALPNDYPFRNNVVKLLLALEEHEKQQIEFSNLLKPNPEGTHGTAIADGS